MTEQEWLASEDTAAMLNVLTGYGSAERGQGLVHQRPMSDRLLRLFACAVWTRHALKHGDDLFLKKIRLVEEWADGEAARPSVLETVGLHDAGDAATLAAEVSDEPAPAGKAALLRDIAGNPFRPVTLPPGPEVREWAKCDNPRCEGGRELNRYTGERVPCPVCYGARGLLKARPGPWLTPQVLALAEAAYGERARECGRCHNGYRMGPVHVVPCECKGTGMMDDGRLDNARLAVLSDCLEESGCVETSEEAITGMYVCEQCGTVSPHIEGRYIQCRSCDSRFCRKQRMRDLPHPLLQHLRSPGPHVRGCWALDILLGKG